MIQIAFELGGENVQVIIKDNDLLFLDIKTGTTTTIEGLHLSKSGCIKEFPDLKDNVDWKKESLNRFKLKVKSMETEKEKMEYIISELTKQGYKALYFQRAGFRPEKIRSI